jgi:hypothetical protein
MRGALPLNSISFPNPYAYCTSRHRGCLGRMSEAARDGATSGPHNSNQGRLQEKGSPKTGIGDGEQGKLKTLGTGAGYRSPPGMSPLPS